MCIHLAKLCMEIAGNCMLTKHKSKDFRFLYEPAVLYDWSYMLQDIDNIVHCHTYTMQCV